MPQPTAWGAMMEDQQDETAARGVAAVKTWEEAHKNDMLDVGGPLRPTKRIGVGGRSRTWSTGLIVFMVVKAGRRSGCSTATRTCRSPCATEWR